MDDFRAVLVEELKAINRKLLRMEDKIHHVNTRLIEGDRDLEDKLNQKIAPISAHVVAVKFIGRVCALITPPILGALFWFLRT